MLIVVIIEVLKAFLCNSETDEHQFVRDLTRMGAKIVNDNYFEMENYFSF